MQVIEKDKLEELKLPGRIIQKAVGKDAFQKSNKMTLGFARYSKESGPMATHHHADKIRPVEIDDQKYAFSKPI